MKRLMVMTSLAVSLSSCGNFGCSNDTPSEGGGFGMAVKPTDEEMTLFSFRYAMKVKAVKEKYVTYGKTVSSYMGGACGTGTDRGGHAFHLSAV